jgi:hypothetical protein
MRRQVKERENLWFIYFVSAQNYLTQRSDKVQFHDCRIPKRLDCRSQHLPA